MSGGAAQRLRLALLAILAASPRGMSRDTLAALLWGDRDEERARHSLEQALYGLKSALGSDPIQRTSTALALDPAVMRSDVADFDRAIAGADWAAAVKTYGGPFLDGVYLKDAPEFERWSERERTRRRDAYQRALEELARAADQQAAPDEAVRWWRRLHEENPSSTRAAIGLARALAAAGDPADALRVAEALAQSGAKGRDVAPELEQLLQQLRGEKGPGTTAQRERGDARSALAGDSLSVALGEALGTSYRIEGRLVRSRLYAAFHARHLATGKSCIVKVLEPSIVRFSDRVVLMRHLERAATLQHENLSASHGLGAKDLLIFLICSDDKGETLRECLRRQGELAIADGLRALRQVAGALAHAHDAGVLHLDLTPKRILLTSGGALLQDTGIASAFIAAGSAHNVSEESIVVLGTPAYMSPELLQARGAPNEQSDLFSLAAIFYQALTGALPFGPGGAGSQPRPAAPSPAAIRSTIPAAVDAALRRALSPVRSDRQASINAFLRELPAS